MGLVEHGEMVSRDLQHLVFNHQVVGPEKSQGILRRYIRDMTWIS